MPIRDFVFRSFYLPTLLLLSACGGNGSGGNSNTNPPPDNSGNTPACTPDADITRDNIRYHLVLTTSYCANVYFEADSDNSDDQEDALLADIEGSLDDIDNKLSLTGAVILVDADLSKVDPVSGIWANAYDKKSVALSVDYVVATYTTIRYTLASELLKSRRRISQELDATLLHALVTEGLAIGFGTAIAGADTLPEEVLTLPESGEWQALLADADAQLDSNTFSSDDWFAGTGELPEGAGQAVGYEMVQRYLHQHPGSSAAYAYAIEATEFALYLQPFAPDDAAQQLKPNQSVHTDDLVGQIEVEILEAQAAEFRGGYFLEGLTHRKTVALTFDDGPSMFTTQVLAVLAEHNIKATFFLTGANLAAGQEIAKAAYAAGHTLANHTLLHAHNSEREVEEFWTESVNATNDTFEEVLGFRPRLFRPSYGEISDAQVEYLNDRNMKVILWSIDTRDWNTVSVDSSDIVSTANGNLHEEAIILMHDAGGDRQNTVDALESIIAHYRDNGYDFVTVDQMIGVSKAL